MNGGAASWQIVASMLIVATMIVILAITGHGDTIELATASLGGVMISGVHVLGARRSPPPGDSE